MNGVGQGLCTPVHLFMHLLTVLTVLPNIVIVEFVFVVTIASPYFVREGRLNHSA